MAWNKDQLHAIEATTGNILVSASAGSGKTGVLGERTFRLIKSGVKLDEFLILTFTNKAAANMKERIRRNLLDDGLIEKSALLDAVNIQTFDAFALNLVKKYYYKLGLAEDISLVDASLLALEERRIIESIFSRLYTEKDQEFLSFIKDYAVKEDDFLVDFVLEVSHKADLAYDKNKWLDEKFAGEFVSKEFIDKLLEERLIEFKTKIDWAYEESKKIEYDKLADPLIDYFDSLSHFKTYNDFANFYLDKDSPSFPRGQKNSTPDDKVIFESLKEVNQDMASFFTVSSIEEIYDRLDRLGKNIIVINRIIKELDARLLDFKIKYNSFDFKDIFKFALTLVMEHEDVKEELKHKFKYIMIDEYQDTSDLQELFISQIANNNLFMVGDIKQSIYRFRNANPSLFLEKFNSYVPYEEAKEGDNRRIDFKLNYRSSDEVIDYINEVFRQLMTKEQTGLDYTKEHQMIAGAGYKNKEKNEVSIKDNEEIYFTVGDKELSEAKEAEIIASDILRRISIGEQVYDDKANTHRPITFKDFAILSYSSKTFLTYQKVFERYSIPLFANYKKKIHESDIALALENVVRSLVLIKENADFAKLKHSYISILRSFLVSESDEYISDVIIRENYKDDKTYQTLERINELSKDKTIAETIEIITNEFDIYERIINLGDVNANLELLSHYFEIAKMMDNMRFKLGDLVSYFDGLEENEIEPDYNATSAIDNAVQLMTIHASKGLEFKYVYIAQTYRKFNFLDAQGNEVVSNKYGIHLPDHRFEKINNITLDFIKKEEKKESILEQLRVFYVALSRAQEKLIIMHRYDETKEPKVEEDILSMKGYFSFLESIGYHITRTNVEITGASQAYKIEKNPRELVVEDKLELNDNIVSKKRASKDVDEAIDLTLLELGNKYHYYLELVDFKTKDVSFIKDLKDRTIIKRFLSNDIFNEPNLERVLHEYSYYDKDTDISGKMDLVLIYNDHINIVDFKLSHVDDTEYEKQVLTYKDYLVKISSLPIKLYITGILSGDIKEVK